MKTDLIHILTGAFEAHAQQTENGIEFWLARDLQYLLGYDEWRNFTTVISKAKTSCEVSGYPVADHFVDVNKTIAMPKGAGKEPHSRLGGTIRHTGGCGCQYSAGGGRAAPSDALCSRVSL